MTTTASMWRTCPGGSLSPGPSPASGRGEKDWDAVTASGRGEKGENAASASGRKGESFAI
ncbi:hypothetical protein [Plasmodium yoelii yoelii]|uniref:Uncharacterized protein n=1 Tax=Plasmodium yoelii yoelii TaxID=73239 RepID=Q7R720_PLAYO|nr:hypothetical protein [Plasmodium yoelii yoelii]